MPTKFLKYTFGAVGLYLVVKNAKGFNTALTSGANGYRTMVRTLQGR